MTDIHEQTIQEFLEPLRSIEPVKRPAARTARRQQPGMRVAEYAGIVLGVVALVGAIAFLSHHRSGSVRPAGSGTVAGHGQARGPFAVARGWLTVGGETVWAFDPADPARRVVLWHHPGDPVEWSRDGTKLLIDGFNAGFFVVDADGSATRVARGTNPPAVASRATDAAVIYSKLGRLYRVSSHGGRAHVIAMGELPGSTGGMLSPDGTTLALQTDEATTLNIATGQRHTVLTAAQVRP